MGWLAHWGLSAPPFLNDPDPAGFVPVGPASAALAKLRHGVAEGSAAALEGAAGVGKTLLLHRLLADFSEAGWRVAYLPRPDANPADWLARLDPDGRAPRRPGQSDFSRLEDYLRRIHIAGQRTLVAVDDLQAVRDPAPADLLRALFNVVADGRRVVHLALAGRTGWTSSPELSDLAGCCGMRVRLEPLSAGECRQYLLARLALLGAGRAGDVRGIMTKGAADEIAARARGVPRDVNRLADLALVTGFGLGARKITPDLAAMAAADLGLPPADQPAPPPGDDVLEQLARDPENGASSAPPVARAANEPEDILAALAAEV